MTDALLAERGQLLHTMEQLSPEEWASPSACSGWSASHVAAHMYLWDGLPWGLFWKVLTQQPAHDWMQRHVALAVLNGPGHLLEGLKSREMPLLARLAPTGRMMMYAETVIHHEDIRRPTGRPRQVSPDQDALWQLVRFLAARQLRTVHSSGRVALCDDQGRLLSFRLDPPASPQPLKPSQDHDATVTGEALELAMFLTGRHGHGVEVQGDTPLAYELRTRRLAF
jgi:uncharacterized protein (TIGR03083 family)